MYKKVWHESVAYIANSDVTRLDKVRNDDLFVLLMSLKRTDQGRMIQAGAGRMRNL